ncbi:Chromatin assembly factor 1, subunit A [Geranomyces variabilis]|uniref:Chromatin assembly factor 1, subunit A n=1 Tax=Geranomyces variabilis TaxID=109894 RepID=A0AAD5TFQ8_9FUNG|nr:Chromatin assembly factor 1, subunit A [Geranomyces variabilis]
MEITSNTPPPMSSSPAPADATPAALSVSGAANMDVETAATPSETTPQKREADVVDAAGEPDRKKAKRVQTPAAAPATDATMTDAVKTSRKRPKAAPSTTAASTKPAASAKKEEKQKEKQRKAAERAAEKALKEQKLAEKKAEKEKRDAEKEQKVAEKKAEKEKREAERKAAEQKLAEKKAEKEEREAERKAAKAADEAKLCKQRALLGMFFTPVKKTEDSKVKIPDTVASNQLAFWQHFPPFQISARTQVAAHNAFWKSLPEGFSETLFRDASVKPSFQREPVPPKTALHDGWKLLQFHGDLRPAYWGGWIKTSKLLSGRRPFAQDSAVLDYDYDSEAEWEEEEPGEVIGSDNEDEEDEGSRVGADSDDEEASWLVPHGYLSDDEGMANEAGGPPSPNSKIAIHDNNDKKRSKDAPKWGVLAPLVPVIHGPCFAPAYFSSETATDERARQALVHLRAQVLFVDVAIGLDPFEIDPNASSDSITASATIPNAASGGSKRVGPKKIAFPEDQLPDLLSKITGAAGLPKLIDELKATPQFTNIPKATLEAKIREVAVREKRVGDQKARWYVRDVVVAGSTDSRASSACLSAPTTPTKKKPTIVDLLTSPLRPRAAGS